MGAKQFRGECVEGVSVSVIVIGAQRLQFKYVRVNIWLSQEQM